jgi:hypothetical protein
MVARRNIVISQQDEDLILARFVDAVIDSRSALMDAVDRQEWSTIVLDACRQQQAIVQREDPQAGRRMTIDADMGIRRMAV